MGFPRDDPATSVGAALLAGGALGVRHAVESDHVAAVAAIGTGVAMVVASTGAGLPV